jgi:hypothetical protein
LEGSGRKGLTGAGVPQRCTSDEGGNGGGAASGGQVGQLGIHKGGQSMGARQGGDGWGRPWPKVACVGDSSVMDIADVGLRVVLGGRWCVAEHSSERTSGTRGDT